MKNSNVQEKSRGVLLFAFNTDTVDYVKIAKRAERLIEHTLKLPVTIITDEQVENAHSNFKNAEQMQWRNADRYRAFELSPYDETLLLDSDYLMLDNSLLKLFDQPFDYRLQHHNHIIGDTAKYTMGEISLPFVWATVVLFRKTQKTKLLFDLVGRIQRNYQYYRLLYNIRERNFRNDYAFAIANSIINGYDLDLGNSIPWTMLSIQDPVTKIDVKNHNLIVRLEDKAHVIPKQNVHIMDKQYLLSDEYEQLVEEICNPN